MNDTNGKQIMNGDPVVLTELGGDCDTFRVSGFVDGKVRATGETSGVTVIVPGSELEVVE